MNYLQTQIYFSFTFVYHIMPRQEVTTIFFNLAATDFAAIAEAIAADANGAAAITASAASIAAAKAAGSKLSSFRFIIWMLHIGWKKCHHSTSFSSSSTDSNQRCCQKILVNGTLTRYGDPFYVEMMGVFTIFQVNKYSTYQILSLYWRSSSNAVSWDCRKN